MFYSKQTSIVKTGEYNPHYKIEIFQQKIQNCSKEHLVAIATNLLFSYGLNVCFKIIMQYSLLNVHSLHM